MNKKPCYDWIIILFDELEGFIHLDLTANDEAQALEVAGEMYPDAHIKRAINN